MKKNILNEVTRMRQIMGLYEQLSKTTTQEKVVNIKPLFLNFQNNFEPSKTGPLNMSEEQKSQIMEWLNQTGLDDAKIVLNIESSSSKSWGSQVKNEQEAIEYNKKLSLGRANTAKVTLTEYIKSIKPNILIEPSIDAKANQGPEYTRNVDNPNDQKYKDYQYVRATLSISGTAREKESTTKNIPFYRVVRVNFEPGSRVSTKPHNIGLVEGCVSVINKNGVFTCQKYVPMYYSNNLGDGVGENYVEVTDKNKSNIFTDKSIWVPYKQNSNGGWTGSDLNKGIGEWSSKNDIKRQCYSGAIYNTNIDCGTIKFDNYIGKLDYTKNPPGEEISVWALEELKKGIPSLYNNNNNPIQ